MCGLAAGPELTVAEHILMFLVRQMGNGLVVLPWSGAGYNAYDVCQRQCNDLGRRENSHTENGNTKNGHTFVTDPRDSFAICPHSWRHRFAVAWCAA